MSSVLQMRRTVVASVSPVNFYTRTWCSTNADGDQPKSKRSNVFVFFIHYYDYWLLCSRVTFCRQKIQSFGIEKKSHYLWKKEIQQDNFATAQVSFHVSNLFLLKKKKLKMRFDDFFFSNHEFNRVLKIGRSYLFCELQG